MTDSVGFWVFHLPNLMLAALIYTLLGRYILSLFFPPDSDKVIWRVFCQITDPILSLVRLVTPALVPMPLLNLFAIVWLFLLRFLLFYIVRMLGLLPAATG
ncbi:YggT family protein [Bosea sp. LjRoot237]|uniref:YggT family protein n=1 Tax=Bosea sp. LjRoot237 TaxID=3342292 RepID=UPI003ECD731C